MLHKFPDQANSARAFTRGAGVSRQFEGRVGVAVGELLGLPL